MIGILRMKVKDKHQISTLKHNYLSFTKLEKQMPTWKVLLEDQLLSNFSNKNTV